VSAQEPHILNSQICKSFARLYFAFAAKCSSASIADAVASVIASGGTHYSYAPMLIKNGACEIAANISRFIIGVCDDKQDIGFITVVRPLST